MKLGIGIGYGEPQYQVPIESILHAEALGYHTVWTAETYGADALSPLAFIAAHTERIKLATGIVQLDARTPANLAMTAQTIDAMAGGGRVMIGIGVSGPQIVEGWYGRPWGKPNPKLRDTVAIMKKIFRRQGPVSHDGKAFSLPYTGEGSIGLGKPLKSILHAAPDIPILLGTGTDLNIRMTAEVADGWLCFHVVPSMMKDYLRIIEEGLAKRTDGKTLKDFEIVCGLGVMVTDDVKAGLAARKPHIALFVGGMGAKEKNFHVEGMINRGYRDAALRIQELYLAGRKDEAADAVPDEYVDEEWLIGPAARLKERYAAWRDAGFTELRVQRSAPEAIEAMAKIAL
ncbi:MAG: LLM class F420-dependent oxidoreductase [Sphingomonadaceae bacterium]|nr:LLM class F420-dependent oxidoreductase [Sphingomonadaceae bacterium]